jgi:uncharacterized membrane protein YjfL (UPF0719 family)
METLVNSVLHVANSIPQFVGAFAILWLGKVLYDKTTTFSINDELTEKDNPAFGVAFAGYLIGIAIALVGAFVGRTGNLVDDLITVGYGGAIAIVLMRISVWVNDTFILNKFSVQKEICTDRNIGTGFVVAGSCIATGLMIAGVLTGESASLLAGVRDCSIYFVAGQILLVIGAKCLALITSFDIHKVIEDDDNVPAGIAFAGFLIAIGIMAKGTLAGASGNIANELIITFSTAAIGIPLLLAAAVICDKIFLPNSPLEAEVVRDKNPAAGAVSLASYVSVALLVSSAIG